MMLAHATAVFSFPQTIYTDFKHETEPNHVSIA